MLRTVDIEPGGVGGNAHLVRGFTSVLSSILDANGAHVHVADHFPVHGHVLANQQSESRQCCSHNGGTKTTYKYLSCKIQQVYVSWTLKMIFNQDIEHQIVKISDESAGQQTLGLLTPKRYYTGFRWTY